jgi:hypothetical protein
MECELEHLLRTHSDHEVVSEQGSLRDLLTSLRGLSEELQLDFEEALTQSDAAYQDRREPNDRQGDRDDRHRVTFFRPRLK